MAKGGDPRKDARRRRAQRARDAYRREVDRKRAERTKGKDIKVPPFDPKEFVRMERLRAIAMLHAIAYSGGLTALLIGVGELVGAPTPFALLALLLIGSLYPYMKKVWDIDMTKLGRWTAPIGMWFAYFITFMMVAFIMSNPPFIDYASPEIHCCEYFVPGNNTTLWVQVSATNVTIAGGQVKITAYVIDNNHVETVRVHFADPNGNMSNLSQMTPEEGNRWAYVLGDLQLKSYTVFLEAKDDAGHTTFSRASMTIV